MSGAGTSIEGPRKPCWKILVREEKIGIWYLGKLLSESSSDSFQLLSRVLFRINRDSSLGSAKWHISDRALPGHKSGKSLDLIHIDVGRVSHTALGWEAVVRVLSSVAGENLV